MSSKMPKAWLEASTETKKTEVKASLDMSADVAGQGLCPECKKPMVQLLADDLPVMVCEADNIALPLKDDQE